MAMLWVKALHVIFMVAWFAGLFYLPRLFVYHAMSEDETSLDRFKVMERRLYYGIMTPAAILTTIFGVWMLWDYAWGAFSRSGWMHAKLSLVVLLYVYHFFCGCWLKAFARDENKHSDKFFRWMNEVPFLFLLSIVVLVIVKPF